MSAFVAEVYKLVSLRSVQGCAVAAVAGVVALTWLNGSGLRSDLEADPAASLAAAPEMIGIYEVLVVVAMLSAIGVLAASQEYTPVSEEIGGGRQGLTSTLAVPSRSRLLLAKLTALIVVGGLVAVTGVGAGLLAADLVLGDFAVPIDSDRLLQGGRGALYSVLMALFGAVVTVLLRNGLFPMIYLVANSLVISVGYLLTRVTPLAWYLPDTAGTALVRLAGEEPDQPSALVGGLVMLAWIVVLGAAALISERRRDV